MEKSFLEPANPFARKVLPHLGKQSFRLGVAGNYGLGDDDIDYAAERGVNFWFWTPRFRRVTAALRRTLARDRDHHVVATAGWAYTAGMVRRSVDRVLQTLQIDQVDLYLLAWLGRGSLDTQSIQHTLLDLKDRGKIRTIGISIHDRERAGRLVQDSIYDAFMIRYNAAHPGAEQDIFPHLTARRPLVIAYTATSWRQLIRPLRGLNMPSWPGPAIRGASPPPLSAGLCYRFCLSSSFVHVVLTGPKNRRQLDENLAALEEGPLSPEQLAWVRDFGREVKARRKIPYF